MILGALFKSSVAWIALLAYTSVDWAHNVLTFLINQFKPKWDHQLQSLILKFNSLVRVFGETIYEYTNRNLEYIAKIRGVDPSKVPTDECITIRVWTEIEFGLSQFYAAL